MASFSDKLYGVTYKKEEKLLQLYQRSFKSEDRWFGWDEIILPFSVVYFK